MIQAYFAPLNFQLVTCNFQLAPLKLLTFN